MIWRHTVHRLQMPIHPSLHESHQLLATCEQTHIPAVLDHPASFRLAVFVAQWESATIRGDF